MCDDRGVDTDVAGCRVAHHLDILHDHIYVIGCLNDLIKTDDVWVHEES